MIFPNKAAKKAATLTSKFRFGTHKKPALRGEYSVLVPPLVEGTNDGGKSVKGAKENPNNGGLAKELGRIDLSGDQRQVSTDCPFHCTATIDLHTFHSTTGKEGWSVPPVRRQARRPSEAAPVNRRTSTAPSLTPWSTSNNWRDRDPRAQLARNAAACTLRTSRTRATYTPGPRPQSGMLHANLKKGTIVWRWDDRTNKGRYWLIVHSTSKKVWDIAIYTNGDTGLRNLGPGRRRHYFSLRPMGVDAADFKNQSSTHDYVSIDCMNRDDRQIVGKPMRSTMIARFTEVFEHDINKEGLRVVGAIAEKDVVFAVGKAWDYIKK